MCTQNIRIFHLNSYDCNLLKKLFDFSDEESLLILNLHPGNGFLVRDNIFYLFKNGWFKPIVQNLLLILKLK